mgnify:CR=1 FL=1
MNEQPIRYIRGGGYSSELRAMLVRDAEGKIIYHIYPLALKSPRLDMSLLKSNPPPKDQIPMRLYIPQQVEELMDEIERTELDIPDGTPRSIK